jgi:DNA-binding Lrp family transcriptional regulator
VDEETVRNRLRMMREMGLLRGWRLIVNARLLGMESSNFVLEFPSPESKEAAIPRIREVDGVVLIQNFFDKTLQVTMFRGNGDDSRWGASEIIGSSAIGGAGLITRWKVSLPRCEHKPKEIDWRIIGLMLRNAERKFPEVARELKVSTRTVKRRVNLMMGSSAFFVQPVLDLRKAVGVTPCQLLIECSPEKKRAIDDLVVSKFERIVFRLTNSETHSTFTVLCSNVSEMKEILNWTRAQEGVRLAKTYILEDQDYVHEWLEREVGKRTYSKPAGNSRAEPERRPKPQKTVIVSETANYSPR